LLLKQEIKANVEPLNEEEVNKKTQAKPEYFKRLNNKYLLLILILIVNRVGYKEITPN
jgi:hypothetical protein